MLSTVSSSSKTSSNFSCKSAPSEIRSFRHGARQAFSVENRPLVCAAVRDLVNRMSYLAGVRWQMVVYEGEADNVTMCDELGSIIITFAL
jgi:hypothetical protein